MTLEEAKELSGRFIAIIDDTKDTMSEWHGYCNAEMHQVKRIIQTLINYIENESIPEEKVKEVLMGEITAKNITDGDIEHVYAIKLLQELLGDD